MTGNLEHVAIIGVGAMGLPMARRLLASGHVVTAYDVSRESLQQAQEAGCRPAKDPREAVRAASIVLAVLPSATHVESLLLSYDIAHYAEHGTLFVDCTTIALEAAHPIKARVQHHVCDMIDSPISGGASRAPTGELTFMVGRNLSSFERAKPILLAMGRSAVELGGDGAGLACKLGNNLIFAASLAAVSEAFALVQSLGIDPRKFF